MDLSRALGWLPPERFRQSPRARPAALRLWHTADYVAALERALQAAGSNAPAPASTMAPPTALRLVTDAAANIVESEDGRRKAA